MQLIESFCDWLAKHGAACHVRSGAVLGVAMDSCEDGLPRYARNDGAVFNAWFR